MRKRWFLILVVLVVSAFALAACGGGGGGEGGQDERPETEVPAPYAGMTNPLGTDQAAVDAGKTVYTQNCASCHGDSGKGDGPAGQALDPKASDLVSQPLAEDYINWRIHEGGAMDPFNSAMPAWKGVLTDDQIWQVVSYIKSLE